jgi:hypothetical protein
MKHLKPFNIFEAVIIPTPIEDNANVNSFESAVAFGQRNDFNSTNNVKNKQET